MQSLADHTATIAKASSVSPLPHDANACSLPRAVLWELLHTNLSRPALFHAIGASNILIFLHKIRQAP